MYKKVKEASKYWSPESDEQAKKLFNWDISK